MFKRWIYVRITNVWKNEILWQHKKINKQNANWRKHTSLEVAEVVLVQCNLVDNLYQQKSEVLYNFTPNKFYVYLLNVERSNIVFLKTYNTDFDEIIITFADQNFRPSEVEDKVNLTLLISNRNNVLFYRTKNKKIC